jgi:hypothetical protein
MVVLVATVAGQAKYELQMSGAQSGAEQEQALVVGAFNDALKSAENTSWPTTPYTGTNPCSLSGQYPQYCIDGLQRPIAAGLQSIPIRVTYQMSDHANVKYAYGWVLINNNNVANTSVVTGFRYWHMWCPYQTDSSLRTRYGPCVQGG